MKKVILDFLDLSNDTLKNIYDFQVYDADKIILNYKNFTQEEISKKALSLASTWGKLMKLLHEDIISFQPETDDDKFWIRFENNEDGEIDNIECNTEEIMEIIQILNDVSGYESNNISFYIEQKVDDIITFRRKFRNAKGVGKRYFNQDVKIIENLIS